MISFMILVISSVFPADDQNLISVKKVEGSVWSVKDDHPTLINITGIVNAVDTSNTLLIS